MTPRASLLVAAYEQPEYLRRTLLGIAGQSISGFETLICDDGSGPEVGAVVEEFRKQAPGDVRHIRQENRGFRKCRALNRGVHESRSEYLVFLDGDCVPHSHFVEEHLRERRPGCFLAGRRVMLDERATLAITDKMIRCGRLDRAWVSWLPSAIGGALRHLEAGVYLPACMRPRGGDAKLKGCNFSCWKKDLERINGFDESFVTPGGGEDTDVERRFLLLGLRPRSVKHAAICFHQYHPVASRTTSAELCLQRAEEGNVTCRDGLQRHGIPDPSPAGR